MAMKKKILFFGVLITLFSIIGYNIYQKVQKAGRGARPNEFAVSVQILKKEPVNVSYEFNGILEGDPQVKVYSDITGKFIRNAVSEGDYVKKDDTLSYIDRDLIGQDFKPAIVRSPISGMVKKLYFIDRGAAVNTALPVAEIANTESIKVLVNVGQEYLSKIRKGMPVQISPTFDRSVIVRSSITTVTPFVDSDTLTGSFEVKAPNNKGMKIGSSVVVNVITGKIDTYMVPQGAVNMGINEIYVFLNDNGKAKKVQVAQGYVNNERVEIKGNLKNGDELITEGSFKLSDGSKVKIVNDQPKQEEQKEDRKKDNSSKGDRSRSQK
jgi:multidrug efflux pump subunit AcrA (membrane-fusion protein)